MKKGTKIVIGSALLIGASVGIYFAFFYKKKPVKPTEPEKQPLGSSNVKLEPTVTKKPNAGITLTNTMNRSVYSTGDSVRIRTQPSISGSIIANVNKGELAGVSAGKEVDGWVMIYSNKSKTPTVPVYISKQYAKIG